MTNKITDFDELNGKTISRVVHMKSWRRPVGEVTGLHLFFTDGSEMMLECTILDPFVEPSNPEMHRAMTGA